MAEKIITFLIDSLPSQISEIYNSLAPEEEWVQKKEFYLSLFNYYYKAKHQQEEIISPLEARVAGFMEGLLNPTIHDSYCYNHPKEYAGGNKSGRIMRDIIRVTSNEEQQNLEKDIAQIEGIIMKIC